MNSNLHFPLLQCLKPAPNNFGDEDDPGEKNFNTSKWPDLQDLIKDRGLKF